jgi:hypothetical protein
MTEIHRKDWGTKLEIRLKDQDGVVPLASAIELKIRLTNPDDEPMIRDLAIITPPGADGWTRYVFQKHELTPVGTWSGQVTALFPDGYWQSDIFTFEVGENLIEVGGWYSASASASPSPS